jgi:hypothetical protein
MTLEEYHGQLHNHHHSGDEDMETEEHDGSYQPVSDAKMMKLGRIIKDLRTRVPISAEAPGEETAIPDTPDVSLPSTGWIERFFLLIVYKCSSRDSQNKIQFTLMDFCFQKRMWMIFVKRVKCLVIIV